MQESLQSTYFFDFDTPEVQQFADQFIDPKASNKDNAIALYYGVRDAFIYNPYHLDLRKTALKASEVLKKNKAWCVEKSTLFIACCRYAGIPSKPGYAIVVNHIGTEKLEHVLQRKEIVFHGYASILIDRNWLKVSPAFDKRICRVSGVSPLDFDGEHDALLQAYEGDQRFMEYTHDYGTFDDVPVELMNSEMKKYYPHLFKKGYTSKGFTFNYEPHFQEE